MDNLNIYTVLMMIRGLSNEITVRGLSNDLGISYSTLARCKNGVWPRSITFDAMRVVLEDCRDKYFGGNDDELVSSIRMQLKSQSVDTCPLDAIYEDAGFDAFITELLICASDYEHARELAEAFAKAQLQADVEETTAQDAEKPAPLAEATPEAAEATAETLTGATPESTEAADPATDTPWDPDQERDRHLLNLMLAVPVAVVLLMGVLNISLSSCFAWVVEHTVLFVVLSTFIAVVPVLVGCLIDAPIAWLRYRSRCPEAVLTRDSFAHTAKYGSPDHLVPGEGRYDLTPAYLAYQPVCNILGTMCYVSLLLFVLSLPGFTTFFMTHEWVEYLKVGIVVASLVAYGHMRDQARRPRLDWHVDKQWEDPCENPDVYLPTRVHVWANNFHLVWTFSLLVVLILGLLGYSFVSFRTLESPALMTWPYVQAMLFFAYAFTSYYAVRTQTTAVGALVPGVVCASMGILLVSLVCYLPSWGGALLWFACVVGSLWTCVWVRRQRGTDRRSWLEEQGRSRAYSIAIICCVGVLFVLGVLTASLL